MPSKSSPRSLFCLLVLLCICATVKSSSGDQSLVFQRCVSNCGIQQCHGDFETSKSLALRLAWWTCTDDCKYTCMHDITDQAISKGHAIQQYHGKWPFWRYAGMQEPASVFFSLVNLWAHWLGFQRVRHNIPESHPMKKLYMFWSVLSMNAWFWSAVFHTRDKPITEKFDYFAAASAILGALYYTVIRLFHLYPLQCHPKLAPSEGQSYSTTLKVLTLTCFVTYAGHIYYLTSGPRFDYMYNTIFNLTLGITHNLLWTLYALPSSLSLLPSRFPNRPKGYRPTFATKAGIFVALTTAATALEVFDFPPWARALDAHALWHAATGPIAYFWYHSLVEDSLDSSWREPLLRDHHP